MRKSNIVWGFMIIALVVSGLSIIYARTPREVSPQKLPQDVIIPQVIQKQKSSQKSTLFHFNGLEDSIGVEHAPITIVMYYSLTCPHCYEFQQEDFPEIKKKFIDKGLVRFVFRDFPTDSYALKAAKLAWCQGKGQYLTIAKRLLATQDTWAPHDIKNTEDAEKALFEIAAEFGITPKDYNNCIAPETDTEKAILRTSFELQLYHEINAAPAFIINGKVYDGKPTAESIEKMLRDMNIYGPQQT